MAKFGKPLQVRFTAGLDNRSPTYSPTRNEDGEPTSLRVAKNVEISKTGFLRRRKGITQTDALIGAHSAWSHPQWPDRAFVVAGGTLYQITRTITQLSLDPIFTDLGALPMRYCVLFDRIYATNNLFLLRIKGGIASDLEDAETVIPPTYTAAEPVRRMPAGDHIARMSGRLVVAIAQTLWVSTEGAPEWREIRTRHKPLEQPITLLAGQDDGLWIGMQDLTIFARGTNPSDWQRVESYARGAVEGTLTWIPAEWFDGSEYGATGFAPCWRDTDDLLCVGRPGGRVQRPHEDRLRRVRPEGGAQIPIDREGFKQVMAQMWGQHARSNERMDFQDSWETEIITHS